MAKTSVFSWVFVSLLVVPLKINNKRQLYSMVNGFIFYFFRVKHCINTTCLISTDIYQNKNFYMSPSTMVHRSNHRITVVSNRYLSFSCLVQLVYFLECIDASYVQHLLYKHGYGYVFPASPSTSHVHAFLQFTFIKLRKV